VKEELYETFIPIHVFLPYQQGQLISMFHEAGQIERIEHTRGGVTIQGRIPGRLAARFNEWQATQPPREMEGSEI
jgi:GTP-binding protein HflX